MIICLIVITTIWISKWYNKIIKNLFLIKSSNSKERKIKLQEQLHQASERRDWIEAERLGNELIKLNRS